jgi:hypothetical protein
MMIEEVISFARELVSDSEFMESFEVYSDLGLRKVEENDLTPDEDAEYYHHRNRVMTQIDECGFGDRVSEVVVWIWEYQNKEQLINATR